MPHELNSPSPYQSSDIIFAKPLFFCQHKGSVATKGMLRRWRFYVIVFLLVKCSKTGWKPEDTQFPLLFTLNFPVFWLHLLIWVYLMRKALISGKGEGDGSCQVTGERHRHFEWRRLSVCHLSLVGYHFSSSELRYGASIQIVQKIQTNTPNPDSIV